MLGSTRAVNIWTGGGLAVKFREVFKGGKIGNR